MAEQLYALTPRTADRVRQLVTDGGSTGGRATTGAAARGVTWVLVTGEADEDGWHPGLVHTSAGEEWAEGTLAVLVAAGDVDGAELVEGRRYLCTRTGSAADGTARFRAALGGSTAHGEDGEGAWSALTNFTYVDGPASITVPTAGTYLVWGSLSAIVQVQPEVNGGFKLASVQAKLRNHSAGADIPNTERYVCRVEDRLTLFFFEDGGGLEHSASGSATLLSVVEVEGETEFRIAVRGVWDSLCSAGVHHSQMGFVRLAGAGAGTVGGLSGTFGG